MGQLIRIQIGNTDLGRLKIVPKKRNFKKLKKTFKTVRKQKNYFGITKNLDLDPNVRIQQQPGAGFSESGS